MLGTALPLFVGSAVAGGATSEPSRVRDEVFVSEASVITALSRGHLGTSVDPGDLRVEIGEQRLPVTQIQSLRDIEEWSILVYVVAPLAEPRHLLDGVQAIAGELERLTAMGEVELIVAQPEPRIVEAPGRDPTRLAEALAEVSRRAQAGRLGGDLARLLSTEDPDRTAAAADLVRAQLAMLGRTVDGRCAGEACLLLLVMDGFPLELGTSAPGPAGGGGACCGPLVDELSRQLAAVGWIAAVVSARPAGEEASGPPPQGEVQVDPSGRTTVMTRVWPPEDPQAPISEQKRALVVRPESAPLLRLANATAGFLTVVPWELRHGLEDLRRRSLVWFGIGTVEEEGILPLRVVREETGEQFTSRLWWRRPPS